VRQRKSALALLGFDVVARDLLMHDAFHGGKPGTFKASCQDCVRVERVAAHLRELDQAHAAALAAEMEAHEADRRMWAHGVTRAEEQRDTAIDAWKALYARAADEKVRQMVDTLADPDAKALAALHAYLTSEGACFGEGPEWATAAVALRWLKGHADRIDALEEERLQWRDRAEALERERDALAVQARSRVATAADIGNDAMERIRRGEAAERRVGRLEAALQACRVWLVAHGATTMVRDVVDAALHDARGSR
jgi:hypothetical protein